MSIVTARESLLPDYYPLILECGKTLEGVQFVMGMRKDCQDIIRKFPVKLEADQEKKLQWLKTLEVDLFTALSSWFSAGLADVRRVTWENSSASLLEGLYSFEQVHKFKSIQDLKARLDRNHRRVYCFTHPVTGKNYPLVILHVALEHSITNSIDYLIRSDHHNTSPTLTEPTTAIFYSISSRAGKIGLNQIDLGNHMIKKRSRSFEKRPAFSNHLLNSITCSWLCELVKNY